MKKLITFAMIFTAMVLQDSFCNALSLRYDPEMAKVSHLKVLSLDKTQTVKIDFPILSEKGNVGVIEFDGWADGHKDNSINGTMNIWIALGLPENGTELEYAMPEWNIMLFLRPNQSPEDTAKAIAEQINKDADRPYFAIAHCHKVFIYYKTFYVKNEKPLNRLGLTPEEEEAFKAKKAEMSKKQENQTYKNIKAMQKPSETGMKKTNKDIYQAMRKTRTCVFPN